MPRRNAPPPPPPYDQDCPYCEAPAGYGCVRPNGSPTGRAHVARALEGEAFGRANASMDAYPSRRNGFFSWLFPPSAQDAHGEDILQTYPNGFYQVSSLFQEIDDSRCAVCEVPAEGLVKDKEDLRSPARRYCSLACAWTGRKWRREEAGTPLTPAEVAAAKAQLVAYYGIRNPEDPEEWPPTAARAMWLVPKGVRRGLYGSIMMYKV